MFNALIVDDEGHVVESMVTTIPWKTLGIDRVFSAYSYDQAWKILQEESIDLLFSDIKMPGKNGLELVTRVHEEYPGIRTILLSGYADFTYAQKALRSHVSDYLLKPATDEEIIATVRKVVGELEALTPETAPAGLVDRIHRFVEQNLAGDASLQAVADFVQLTPPYLSRLYKSLTGQNLSEYLVDLRMNKAKHLLENTDKKIFEITRDIGLQNSQYFSKLFQARFGTTPQDYRKGISHG